MRLREISTDARFFLKSFCQPRSGTGVIDVGSPKVESGRKTSPVSPVLPVVKIDGFITKGTVEDHRDFLITVLLMIQEE